MSTRSAIIMKAGKGYKGVYCHFDGYYEGVGANLLEHFSAEEDVKQLIELGDLSTVGQGLNETDGTHAYHRDRGEEYSPPIEGSTVLEVASQIDNNGFVYVYEDGKWTCNGKRYLA